VPCFAWTFCSDVDPFPTVSKLKASTFGPFKTQATNHHQATRKASNTPVERGIAWLPRASKTFAGDRFQAEQRIGDASSAPYFDARPRQCPIKNMIEHRSPTSMASLLTFGSSFSQAEQLRPSAGECVVDRAGRDFHALGDLLHAEPARQQ
jgi:hypothetical protein